MGPRLTLGVDVECEVGQVFGTACVSNTSDECRCDPATAVFAESRQFVDPCMAASDEFIVVRKSLHERYSDYLVFVARDERQVESRTVAAGHLVPMVGRRRRRTPMVGEPLVLDREKSCIFVIWSLLDGVTRWNRGFDRVFETSHQPVTAVDALVRRGGRVAR